jgi:endonuclease/exonuclease/phosphatase family metal-dependent hydrolase
VRSSLTALILVLALTCVAPGRCTASAPSGGGGDETEIRVMSFNLRWGPDPPPNDWDSRVDLVLSVLREQAPDVVGLQESRDTYVDALLARLPDYAAYPMLGSRQNSILYRRDRLRLDRATSDAENARVDEPEQHWGVGGARLPRCARFLVVSSGSGFYVYNNHLDHRSLPSREWSARVLIERIRSREIDDPVILTGDFNAPEDGPVLGFLRGQSPLRDGDAAVSNPVPFVDTFRRLHPDETAVGTYHGFSGVRSGGRVDYVLVGPGVDVLSARILRDEREGRFPSDHFPVSAMLRLPIGR